MNSNNITPKQLEQRSFPIGIRNYLLWSFILFYTFIGLSFLFSFFLVLQSCLLFVCLFIYLYQYLPVFASVCLCISLSLHVHIHVCICSYMYLFWSVSSSACPSVSIYQYLFFSIHLLCAHQSFVYYMFSYQFFLLNSFSLFISFVPNAAKKAFLLFDIQEDNDQLLEVTTSTVKRESRFRIGNVRARLYDLSLPPPTITVDKLY